MSDYSYYLITKEPPTPEPTLLRWLASFIRPVRFVTEGEGRSDFGPVRSKRHWTLDRGRLAQSGIDHTEELR